MIDWNLLVNPESGVEWINPKSIKFNDSQSDLIKLIGNSWNFTGRLKLDRIPGICKWVPVPEGRGNYRLLTKFLQDDFRILFGILPEESGICCTAGKCGWSSNRRNESIHRQDLLLKPSGDGGSSGIIRISRIAASGILKTILVGGAVGGAGGGACKHRLSGHATLRICINQSIFRIFQRSWRIPMDSWGIWGISEGFSTILNDPEWFLEEFWTVSERS